MLLINYITPQLQFILQYNTKINSTIQYYVSIGHIWQQILDTIALILRLDIYIIAEYFIIPLIFLLVVLWGQIFNLLYQFYHWNLSCYNMLFFVVG